MKKLSDVIACFENGILSPGEFLSQIESILVSGELSVEEIKVCRVLKRLLDEKVTEAINSVI